MLHYISSLVYISSETLLFVPVTGQHHFYMWRYILELLLSMLLQFILATTRCQYSCTSPYSSLLMNSYCSQHFNTSPCCIWYLSMIFLPHSLCHFVGRSQNLINKLKGYYAASGHASKKQPLDVLLLYGNIKSSQEVKK